MRISDWSSTCALPIYLRIGLEILRADIGAVPREHVDHLRQSARRVAVDVHEAVAARPGRKLYLRKLHRADRTAHVAVVAELLRRSEEHTSELRSLMRISYAVFRLKKKKKIIYTYN